jgi:hypothetical protein
MRASALGPCIGFDRVGHGILERGERFQLARVGFDFRFNERSVLSDIGPEFVQIECLLRDRADVFEIPRPQADHGVLIATRLEGESPEPESCLPIGECRLSELPIGLPAGSPIEVTYSYGASGQVQVTAWDPIGGKFSEAEIFLSAGLTAPEVESWREFVATISVV